MYVCTYKYYTTLFCTFLAVRVKNMRIVRILPYGYPAHVFFILRIRVLTSSLVGTGRDACRSTGAPRPETRLSITSASNRRNRAAQLRPRGQLRRIVR